MAVSHAEFFLLFAGVFKTLLLRFVCRISVAVSVSHISMSDILQTRTEFLDKRVVHKRERRGHVCACGGVDASCALASYLCCVMLRSCASLHVGFLRPSSWRSRRKPARTRAHFADAVHTPRSGLARVAGSPSANCLLGSFCFPLSLCLSLYLYTYVVYLSFHPSVRQFFHLFVCSLVTRAATYQRECVSAKFTPVLCLSRK